MNFKSIVVLGFSVATLGLTLPAHADTATVVDNQQNVVITGNGNTVHQNNRTTVNNRQTGRQNVGATGSSVTSRQSADILGNGNRSRQTNVTNISNRQQAR
ncbi:hypothetical protein [Chamaesiphon sp.]|uniref:hypothetical protein n=1 Tax=Chamaesiphon sp. TaxID=2814140 RepID=UPI003593E884